MKNLTEEVDREKAGREEAVKTAKEKTKTAESAKKRAAATEKSRASAEKRSAKLVTQQNETEVKLAEVASLNSPLSEEVANLQAALETCESKWYDEGFANAEKGWMAALQALEVPEDSPFRDPGQIPLLDSTPAAQNPAGPNDEEETDNLRELVE